MKILVASDSFKDCMTSLEIAETIQSVDPEMDVDMLPIADGGEGTLEVLTIATGGEFFKADVTGPLGERVTGRYSVLGDGKKAMFPVESICYGTAGQIYCSGL